MQNTAFVQEVVNLTNQYRASNGLAPLFIDFDLEEAAQQHSQNMATQDFFSHTGKDGSRPWDRALSAGYESSFVGENIAAGYVTPEDVVNGWINSPGHRANMLNPDYNEIGVGYYFLQNDTGSVNYKSYWTQVFGKGEIEQVSSFSIDPVQYGASYGDLIQAFGYNPNALLQHYNAHGKYEGRQPDLFNELSYLASHGDLINAFGSNLGAATQHYIQYGYYEGRSTNLFKPAQYLASYDDLINAFGSNLEAATQHYIQHGYYEGRSRDSFIEDRYLASYSDLINAYGYNPEAATQHYISYGAAEGRSTDLFDPEAYLSKYSDLQAAFGSNLEAATRHYIEFGYREGRVWV